MKRKNLDVRSHVLDIAVRARSAACKIRCLKPEIKTNALLQLAGVLHDTSAFIRKENKKDLKSGKQNGLTMPMLDRLELTKERVDSMVKSITKIADANDPIGEVVSQWTRPGGLEVGQMRIPLGVIGIIYESRPNVTADASALCFKAGNAAILRGGSEALFSNLAIEKCIRKAFTQAKVPSDSIQLIQTRDRKAVGELLRMDDFVDVIIPRGGKKLIQRVAKESRIPVIKHFEGICHTFVHRDANLEMALEIILNAKVQRPGTCNAMETLLIDSQIAKNFIPMVVSMLKKKGVRIRGCSHTSSVYKVDQLASEKDYRKEYLGLECNICVVKDLESAIHHIWNYGSKHTDVIVTESYKAARDFIQQVDSSSVMVNASSRLADGGIFGLGAEIGISTDKLHAFGPMGVNELTSKKFVVYGNGSLRK